MFQCFIQSNQSHFSTRHDCINPVTAAGFDRHLSQPTLPASPRDLCINPTSASSSGRPLLFIRPIAATWFPSCSSFFISRIVPLTSGTLSGTSQTDSLLSARLASDDLCSPPPR